MRWGSDGDQLCLTKLPKMVKDVLLFFCPTSSGWLPSNSAVACWPWTLSRVCTTTTNAKESKWCNTPPHLFLTHSPRLLPVVSGYSLSHTPYAGSLEGIYNSFLHVDSGYIGIFSPVSMMNLKIIFSTNSNILCVVEPTLLYAYNSHPIFTRYLSTILKDVLTLSLYAIMVWLLTPSPTGK